ncbi:hypothetical protein Bca101_068145 [Brassica carinata]
MSANTHQQQGARWTNARTNNHRPISNSSLRREDRRVAQRSLEVEENRRRYDDRYLEGKIYASRWPPSHTSRERNSLRASHDSSFPQEPRLRKHNQSYSKEAASRSNHSLSGAVPTHLSPSKAQRPTDPSPDHGERRSSALERLSLPQSEERRPAKERMSNTHYEERLSAQARIFGDAKSEERLPASERLSVQTQKIKREEENNSDPLHTENQMTLFPSQNVESAATITRPSSSLFFDANRLGPCERSPIRSLSEEENVEDDRGDDTPQLIRKASSKTLSKAEGKRVVDTTQDRKRTLSISRQGTTVKKRSVTKAHNSPRWNSPKARTKLLADAIRTGTRASTRKKTTSTAPSIKTIPPIARKEKDFRPLPSSLP